MAAQLCANVLTVGLVLPAAVRAQRATAMVDVRWRKLAQLANVTRHGTQARIVRPACPDFTAQSVPCFVLTHLATATHFARRLVAPIAKTVLIHYYM